MTKHKHEESHSHSQAAKHGSNWQPHRDWRVWGVVLMLIAMAAYILSQNESLNPVEEGEAVPAAVAP